MEARGNPYRTGSSDLETGAAVPVVPTTSPAGMPASSAGNSDRMRHMEVTGCVRIAAQITLLAGLSVSDARDRGGVSASSLNAACFDSEQHFLSFSLAPNSHQIVWLRNLNGSLIYMSSPLIDLQLLLTFYLFIIMNIICISRDPKKNWNNAADLPH